MHFEIETVNVQYYYCTTSDRVCTSPGGLGQEGTFE